MQLLAAPVRMLKIITTTTTMLGQEEEEGQSDQTDVEVRVFANTFTTQRRVELMGKILLNKSISCHFNQALNSF